MISNLATRKVKGLPAEQRNTKPNYWHGHNSTPTPGATHESVYLHPRFTMGSLWDGHSSQHTRFMTAVSSSNGAVVFHGGPSVKQTPGVLTVSDGTESFTVDFRGDLPVYK